MKTHSTLSCKVRPSFRQLLGMMLFRRTMIRLDIVWVYDTEKNMITVDEVTAKF
jgi:hypothetical protein